MQKFFSVIMVIVALSWCISFAQGGMGPEPQVFQSLHNDTSPPLREMEEAPLSPTPWENGMIPLLSRESQFEDQYQKDKSVQEIVSHGDGGFILQSWDGVSAQGFAPPDASGDVGPNHYMEMVNVRFQIWNKTGTSLLGPLNLSTIWQGFPGPWSSSLNDGDPVVLYDETVDRWFAAEFSLPNFPSGPFYMLIAVSQTGDPTGSWHRYGFTFTNMPDYEKFGIWPDAYYMSANSFSSGSLNFIGASATAFDRTQMLAGNPATMVFFQNSAATTWSLLPSDWNGTTTPPAGSPNYFGQQHDNADYGGNDGFDIFQFHVDWVTPGNSTFTGPTFLATNPFVKVNGIPQLSTSTLLDDLDQMTMNRLDYRNFGAHQSMVVCQTVDAGSSRAGVRWYEFRNTGSGWTVYQQGTYAPADGLERWMGSIAINANGDIGLGYSVSSSTIFPEIRYTGRLSGDALGLMTIPEETIQAGLGSQTGLTRWGDYTQMVVDPDGETFWYVNQYQPSTGSFNWRTRIASMNFSSGPCPVGAPTNPNPVSGAIDLPLTGNTLSWTNGAGTTMNEVYWNGNPVPVYDGPAITSFSLAGYEPLTYSTNYTWRVVCKDATCGTSGPTWNFTTIQDPNLVIDTVDVYPQNANYWTGTTTAAAKLEVSLMRILSNGGEQAWAKFDVSSIPVGATIISITANWYMSNQNCPYFQINALPIDPVTAAPATLYAAITGGVQYYLYDTCPPTGWESIELGGNANADLAASLANGWFAISFYEYETLTNYTFTADGWAQTNRPYLEVMYEYVVPVELTSFVATSNNSEIKLSWTTATETNNQGFQVERMVVSGSFEQVGYVAGFGTTTEPKAYSFVDSKLEAGSYTYRLKQIDFDGTFTYSEEVNVDVEIPLEFALEQNYPNPFNPSTTIKYSIADEGFVKLVVYNMLGEEVTTLVNTQQKAGRYEVNFNAAGLSSGVYVYRIEAANYTASKKLILMK